MKTFTLTLTCLTLAASSASATIVSTTGGVSLIGAPPSCVPSALAGVTAYCWDEKQNVPLSLLADMVNNPGSSNSPTPGVLAGVYNSHFLHFEQVLGAVPVTGTITFNAPIVGVIFRNTNLDNSDGPAGAPGTTYPTGFPFRGLVNAPVSFVTISGNVLTFDLSTAVSVQAVDQVRIITQTPAPGSAALLGLAGVTCIRRRRQSIA
jgi:hypothetical protein